jgi:hypothetical protein
LNIKLVREVHPDIVWEKYDFDMNWPDLEIIAAAEIPDRSNELYLIEASMGTDQLEYQPISMDYENSRPTISTPPIQVTNPRIK